MDADFSVELGADDDALEFPWSTEGSLRYYDLKAQPELLRQVPEAIEYIELGRFLALLNGAGTPFLTAKCDAWPESELNAAEEIYGGAAKFASYVDVLFAGGEQRFSFEAHEILVRRLCARLSIEPDIAAAIELVIRRCYYGVEGAPGFYVTAYVSGYDDDMTAARQRWAEALTRLGAGFLELPSQR